MMCVILERAYAKVNFGLKVYPKQADSEFHNIQGIFQTIDLYDELEIQVNSLSSESINPCFVVCDSLILPEKNTLTTAYDAFCRVVDFNVPKIEVHLKKGIPAGGGLGGGSADAAALVRGLEKLCKVKLNEEQKYFIASKTGSDVFFFMECENGKGCALVSGRGENIRKINCRTDLVMLMIFPQKGSSTKEAYALVDELLNSGKEPDSPDFEKLEEIYIKPVKEWTFINTFTPVIRNFIPSVDKAINDLDERGAVYSEMSGSGSTVFGFFEDLIKTEKCYESLKDSYNCKIVQVI